MKREKQKFLYQHEKLPYRFFKRKSQKLLVFRFFLDKIIYEHVKFCERVFLFVLNKHDFFGNKHN